MLPSLLFSSLLAVTLVVSGSDFIIHNTNEFIEFADNVRNKTSYKGVTILLDSDIDLNGVEFEPISNNNDYYTFAGLFDGQGHTISNLSINSSSKYVGLFGYSRGMTVQDVVLDSSCSIISTNYKGEKYIGGIVGYCYGSNKKCNVFNSVNMGSVAFNGNIYKYEDICIGGTVGGIYCNIKYDSAVKNCVNYGTVSHNGVAKYSYIGGIVGYANYINIQNCINHGTIAHNGNSTYLRIGGIVGKGYYAIFDNCVSASPISYNNGSEYLRIGAIFGYETESAISNCYYNENISQRSIEEQNATTFNNDFVLNETVSVGDYKGDSLVDALNAAADKNVLYYYSHWIINKEKDTMAFVVNGETILSLNSRLVLLPNLANEGKRLFDGWYTDSECTIPLADFSNATYEELYSKYGESDKKFTITFDSRGGSAVEPVSTTFGADVEFSIPTKQDYEFSLWENAYGEKVLKDFTMPACNITLYAVWVPIRITDAEGLVELSNLVNSDNADYSGKTVYLENDIEFTDELSKKFEPIGKYKSYYYYSGNYPFFNGTFDGQGHAIKGLTLYASGFIGLFGYSNGLTVRNLIIDSSCNYVETYEYSYPEPYIGAIIGFCEGKNSPCVIENCENRMSISYMGQVDYMYFGGIVGNVNTLNYYSTIKNCTNRGTLEVYKNIDHKTAYIGGIIGGAKWDYWLERQLHIYDCVNYGHINFDGIAKKSHVYMDGIIGYGYDFDVQNCKNHGKISRPSRVSSGDVTAYIVVAVVMTVVAIVFILMFSSLI